MNCLQLKSTQDMKEQGMVFDSHDDIYGVCSVLCYVLALDEIPHGLDALLVVRLTTTTFSSLYDDCCSTQQRISYGSSRWFVTFRFLAFHDVVVLVVAPRRETKQEEQRYKNWLPS